MKILVLIDRKGWAYHRIALAIKRHTDLDVDIVPVKNNKKGVRNIYKKYDRFFLMAHHLHSEVPFIPYDLTGIHGYHSWDNRETTPDYIPKPTQEFIDSLGKYKKVNVVSKMLQETFCDIAPIYTPNGFDSYKFKMVTIPGNGPEVVVGSTSTWKHDWRKGISEIIIPACKKVGLKAVIAWQNVNVDDMPAYYNNIDIYVCASKSEGMSLGLVEAGACGRTLISTRVSGTDELSPVLRFVDRSVNSVAEAISEGVKEPFKTMNYVRDNYSWERVICKWKDFLTT